jgi:hypothetical protein
MARAEAPSGGVPWPLDAGVAGQAASAAVVGPTEGRVVLRAVRGAFSNAVRPVARARVHGNLSGDCAAYPSRFERRSTRGIAGPCTLPWAALRFDCPQVIR